LIERPIGVVLKPGKLEVESKLQKQSCFIVLNKAIESCQQVSLKHSG